MLHLSPEKIALNAAHFGDTGPRKMVLRQDQSPGDILTFTRALCDLKEAYPQFLIDVDTPCPEIFENNPHITPLDKDDPEVELFSVRYDSINQSGWRGHHFSDGFRIALEDLLGVSIPSQGLRPQLFISEEERHWYHLPHVAWAWDKPFWCINAGRKGDNELKQYDRWQAVVDLFNDYFQGEVGMVQIGHSSHIHPPLQGVMNAIGQTDNLRQLIRLGYWAAGIVTPISFPLVMAAAYEQPCVVCAGAKEGVRWHIYGHMRWICRNGCLPCSLSDGCWRGGEIGKCLDIVDGVPRCFAIIDPEEIFAAIRSYYDGGRLKI